MKKTRKRLLIALCVILGIVAVLSAAVRIVLTKDVLMELVLPRLERAVRAEIAVQDIGVRFPFGFGVDIEGLTFEKTMPQGEVIAFEGDRVVARVSLLSLIKRKPVIERVDIDNGSLSAAGGPQQLDARIEGLRARLSMHPFEEGYRAAADLSAEGVVFALREKPPVDLGGITFEGEMTLDAALDSLHIDRGKGGWEDVAAFEVSGGIGDLKRSRRISFRLSSEGISIERLVERVLALGPAQEGERALPAKIRAGTLGLEADVSGSLAQPSDISVSGTAAIDGAAFEHPALPGRVEARGEVRFTESHAESDGISVSLGSSKASAAFDVDIVERKKLGRIEAALDAVLALEDLVPLDQRDSLGAKGSMTLKLDLQGTPEDLASLVPRDPGREALKRIGEAWRSVQLRGTVAFADAAFAPEGSAFRVKKLSGSASIEGGGLKAVDAAFELNGSPYTCTASLMHIMPASMELLAASKEMSGRRIDDLGPLLRGMENAPRFGVKLAGRALDLRPFERKEEEAAAGTEASAAARRDAQPANPFALLALKNTAFEARIDSVVSKKALFTAVNARGTIKDGVLEADSVAFQYAGGRGRARFEADLRRPERIESAFDLSLEGVQADRALGAMHPLGNLLSGNFSFSSDASFTSGPGLDPLASLSGKGSALSSSGSVDISRFIAPLAQTGVIDLSRLSKFDFSGWSGNFFLRDGRVLTDNWKIESNKGDWAIKGSFGFDGTLDYSARLVVPPAVQAEMKDLDKYRDLVALFRDAQGNLVLDLELGGTSTDPRVALDMSGAREKAVDKARDELLKKAKDLFKK